MATRLEIFSAFAGVKSATPPSPSTASEGGELRKAGTALLEYLDAHEWGGIVEGETATRFRAALAAKTAQPSTGEVDVEAERKLFEACMKPGYLSRCTEPGYTDQYADSHTQMAWKAWLAARHTQAEGARDAARNAFKELVKKNTHRRPRIVGNDVEYRNEIDTYQIGRDVIDAAIAATQKGR